MSGEEPLMKRFLLIGAVFFCSVALSACGKSAKQLNNTGIEYFNASEYEKAVTAFEQAIDKDKDGKPEYNVNLGKSYIELGKYEEAISYLNKYNGKDEILKAKAIACKGDAFAGLEKYKDAVSCYEKAAKVADNMFAAAYLLKAGVACEELGDNAKALSFYKTIKDQYPQSMEGYDIDKYISRIENK